MGRKSRQCLPYAKVTGKCGRCVHIRKLCFEAGVKDEIQREEYGLRSFSTDTEVKDGNGEGVRIACMALKMTLKLALKSGMKKNVIIGPIFAHEM